MNIHMKLPREHTINTRKRLRREAPRFRADIPYSQRGFDGWFGFGFFVRRIGGPVHWNTQRQQAMRSTGGRGAVANCTKRPVRSR